jgi:hypothetical protein
MKTHAIKKITYTRGFIKPQIGRKNRGEIRQQRSTLEENKSFLTHFKWEEVEEAIGKPSVEETFTTEASREKLPALTTTLRSFSIGLEIT